MNATQHELSLAHLSVLDATPPQLVTVAAAAGFRKVGIRLSATPSVRVPPYDMLGDTPMLRETLARLADTGVRTLADAARVVKKSGCGNASVLIDALHFSRSGGWPSDIAGVDASLFKYAQICDAVAAISSEPADLIREARTGRLLPGEGALPLRELVAALPATIPLAIEAPVRASAGLSLLERAQRAYRSMQALLG